MKKLHLGLMTNQELADWFGITYGALSKRKEDKLKELKHFAKFSYKKKKVYIEEVYVEVYSKQASKAKQAVEDNLDKVWNENGLDTCSRVSLELKQKLGDDLPIAESTTRKYALEARKKFYGTPWKERGKYGSCTYLWCKKIGDGVDAVYDFLTPEEEEMKKTLLKKYFGDASEKQVIVEGMVAKGEITKEEAWEVLEDLTGMKDKFFPFLLELQDKVGATVVRGTLVEKKVSELRSLTKENFKEVSELHSLTKKESELHSFTKEESAF